MDNCTTIITQSTKDAATLKFFPGRTVYATGVITFQQLEDCTTPDCMTSPVASELLELDGVQKLSFCQDFVLVTKSANTDWEELRPEVLMILAHYSHRPYFQQSDLVCDDKTGCEVEAILNNVSGQCWQPTADKLYFWDTRMERRTYTLPARAKLAHVLVKTYTA